MAPIKAGSQSRRDGTGSADGRPPMYKGRWPESRARAVKMMNTLGLCCWACALLAMGWSGPVAESPSGQELQALQDLLERLDVHFGQEASELDPSDLDEALLPSLMGTAVLLPEAEAQWRRFFASPKRRRYFAGCFGSRLERIGTQTGLGCNVYKPRSWRKPRS
ncbi:natriuretic peptides B-like [Anolis carolinensis]|uniref:natriuretic peptides B-like n=1 Tax=Anolis carolinensis TaxID=28377 RepID=UPI002F2B283A